MSTTLRAAPRAHRTWKQRLLLVTGTIVSIVTLLSAGAAWYVNSVFTGIHRIRIVHAPVAAGPTGGEAAAPAVGVPLVGVPATEAPVAPSKVPAMNVLLTGSDGRSCVDPSSPYAGAFLGNGSDIGQRSDTIVLMRVDPAAGSVAMLSFPRDLWVPIAGTNRKDRINSAFKPDDPNPLIQTIESTFGVRIDHYIGVDFCAFKSMVDAVGGVEIPFAAPARDAHTGLFVPTAGCRLMQGDEALAYVRSRYYEYLDKNRWLGDGTSDYGRINRQQDFIRRLMQRAIDKGITNPLTAKRLLDVAKSSNVRIDDALSLSDMGRLATSLKGLAPGAAATYRIEGNGTLIGGASVIVPALTSPANAAMLAVFRGETPGTTATAVTTAPPSTTASPTSVADTSDATASNMIGVAPAPDASCG